MVMIRFNKIAMTGVVASFLLAACSNNGSKLVNNWEELNHTMTMDVKKDSSITVTQYHEKTEGRWKLSDDEQTFTVTLPQYGDKELLIKELTKDSLVLLDNGNPMIFVTKKGL